MYQLPSFSAIKDLLIQLTRLIKLNIVPIILALITLIFCLRNYDPGTFLTGWDTLHPEFDLKMYWSRILGGVWQEHQALGAVATQAHASEIPRILLLQLLSFVMPANQIRYAYAFLMLILGPLGVYFFLRKIILKKLDDSYKNLGAFCGGLLYLLNLGTLQHFYVPLEMFLVHYGLLGWVFLFATKFFEDHTKRNLLLFVLTTFFIAPQAHTATLFYAYLAALTAYFGAIVITDLFLGKMLSRKNTHAVGSLTQFTVIILFTLLVNSFWFLPNLYFIVKHSSSIQQSKIHQLFSEEAFLQNKEYGTLKDVAILRNFLFSWGEHVGNGKFGDLLGEWKAHLSEPFVYEIGYGVFTLVILGLFISIITRNRYTLSVLGLFFLGLFFIFNVNPPLGFIFVYVQKLLPIFKEAFRFPFTKFSIILMFSYATYFGIFFGHISQLTCKALRKVGGAATLRLILYSIVTISLMYYMKPAFDGDLISQTMRVKIPQRYFDLFTYMRKQKDFGRVANLPIHSFWGWVYYDWDKVTHLGYQGAGFLWFGIRQPLMDREFDRWNPDNEQYYREMTQAIYSEDVNRLVATLEKYQIRWILFDTSIINPSSDEKTLFYPQIDLLLSKAPNIRLEKNFGEGLRLYKYIPRKDYTVIESTGDFVYSSDSIFKEYTDNIYETYGTYANTGFKNFPYLGITEFDESINPAFVSSDEDSVYFKNKLTFASLNVDRIDDLLQYDLSVKKHGKDIYLFKLVDVPGFVRSTMYEFAVTLPDTLSQVVLELNSNLLTINLGDVASSMYTPLGVVTINPQEKVLVRVLTSETLRLKTLNISNLLERCSDYGNQSSYYVETLPGGFRLGARDVDACITIDLDSLIQTDKIENELLEVQVQANSATTNPNLCFFETSTGLCMNKPLKDGGIFMHIDSAKVGKGNYYLRFLTTAVLNQKETNVDYTGLRVNTFKKLYETTLDMSVSGVLQGESFGKLVLKKEPVYSGNVTTLRHSPRLCDRGTRYFADSTVDVVPREYIRYSSAGDSLCDSYEFPSVAHNTGYVLEVRARNIEGLPLRMCLTNEYSKRCDLYVSLSQSHDFQTHYYLIPPMGVGNGYTINLTNLVFGKNRSVNDLQYVSLAPFPYNFLRSIHSDAKKSNGESLIIYNQAYEDGWVAVCGWKPCKGTHVKVNNWANGWVLHSSVLEDIHIFFLPQALEYIGILFFAGSLGLVAVFRDS